MLGQEQKKKKMNDGGGGGGRRKRLPANESIFMSRVPCRGSRVTILFIFFFILQMKNKWKTNKKNLKNKWRVDISNQISSNCWVVRAGRGGEKNTLLDNLRTSSALLTSHVKNVVKKCKKTDLTDILLSK